MELGLDLWTGECPSDVGWTDLLGRSVPILERAVDSAAAGRRDEAVSSRVDTGRLR